MTIQEKTNQETIKMKNPQTGEFLYEVPCATPLEIDQTFERAQNAFEVIRNMTIQERAKELKKLRRWIIENRELIIQTDVDETGKARSDAQLIALSVIGQIDNTCKNAEKWLSEKPIEGDMTTRTQKAKVVYEPVGPVLNITPWNGPFAMVMDGFCSIFMAGNPMINKPSEYSQFHGLLEKMVEESGFVKDGLQVIYGGKETGAACIDRKPARILFTGSTAAGKKVMAHAAEYLIPVVLELGGNDPMIVLEDADIDEAVKGALTGGLFLCGQVCISVERLLVHRSIYEPFVKKLINEFKKVVTLKELSDEKDEGQLDMGGLTPPFQASKIEEHILDAVSKGAKVEIGGKKFGSEHLFEPTLITGVDSTMRISYEETFGPLIAVRAFDTDDEAIRIANEISHGLSSSVWSKDRNRAENIARKIEAGSVCINCSLQALFPGAPYGGHKDSGIGRYHGQEGLHAFSNIKTIVEQVSPNPINIGFPRSKEKYELIDQLMELQKKRSIWNIFKMLGVVRKLGKLK